MAELPLLQKYCTETPDETGGDGHGITYIEPMEERPNTEQNESNA